MIGPADPAQLANQGSSCAFDLDDQGEFARLNLVADWAADATGNHQLTRGEGESGASFFDHARLTYQIRAKLAKDPVAANLLLSAFEKMATTLQTLRMEAARTVPPAASK